MHRFLLNTIKLKTQMPLLKAHNKNVLFTDYSYSEKYWAELSKLIESEYGSAEIKDPDQVDQVLKTAFQFLCRSFEAVINNMDKASFYLFINMLHEDSLDLYRMQLEKIPLGIDESAFAVSRRILKIIIEQGCRINLKGTANFIKEVMINHKVYVKTAEELLYLGEKAYELSEAIAKNKLFPGSTGVSIDDGEFTMNTYQPYPELHKFIAGDIPKHDEQVAVSQSIEDFKSLLLDKYGVKYDDLAGFTARQLKNPIYKLGMVFLDNLIDTLHTSLGYDKEFLKVFYAGLTLSAENALLIEECITKNQDPKRFIYRPIVKFCIDGKYYYMITFNKWTESLMTLTTNALPFGVYPEEWKVLEDIKVFVQRLDNTHDKILEDPIVKLLSDNKFFYDTSVESFKNKKGRNVNIASTVGDLDVIFTDPVNKIIYVCELKHNRSRFDYNNWRRDYSNFKPKYENQLDRKVEWTEKNIHVVQEHFEITHGSAFAEDLSKYKVRGIFIINAPTMYMYDGKYRAFTINDISNLLKNKFVDTIFEFTQESSGKKYVISHPYFENVRKKFQEP